MTHVTEILMIIVIVAVVFGLGKMPSIASNVARMRTNFKRGLKGEPDVAPIDITPGGKEPVSATSERKPGHFNQHVEDAQVEDA